MSACRIESRPGRAKTLKNKAGDTQMTLSVGRDRATAFAAALLSGDPPCESAELVIEETSAPLYHVGPLIAHPPLQSLGRDTAIAATGREVAEALLTAALSDCVDCWFVPNPGGLVVHADDNECVTLFAHRQRTISRAVERLRAAGFLGGQR